MILKRAGKMVHRIAYEAPAQADRNSFGEPREGYAAAVERWACVEELSGRELESARAVAGEVTHQVTVWHYPGYLRDGRVSYRGRHLNVEAVLDPDGRKEQVRLLCREKV